MQQFTIIDSWAEDYGDVDETGAPVTKRRVYFKLLFRHPVHGKQTTAYEWRGSPGLDVDAFLALGAAQKRARLNQILRPHLAKVLTALNQERQRVDVADVVGEEVTNA